MTIKIGPWSGRNNIKDQTSPLCKLWFWDEEHKQSEMPLLKVLSSGWRRDVCVEIDTSYAKIKRCGTIVNETTKIHLNDLMTKRLATKICHRRASNIVRNLFRIVSYKRLRYDKTGKKPGRQQPTIQMNYRLLTYRYRPIKNVKDMF